MTLSAGTIRYDDMLRTVLGQQRETADMRSLGWQQLVDILARRGDSAPESADVQRAYQYLGQWRSDVSSVQRERSAAMIVAMSREQRLPSALFAHFAGDEPRVASVLLGSAAVDESELIAIMPRMNPASRSILRSRNDLGPRAKAVLQGFGPSDLALTSDAPAGEGAPGITPISELVDRIAHYRRRHIDSHAAKPSPTPARIGQFDYETGRDCVIRWIDAPWRGAVIGLSLSEPAPLDEGGVDAASASSFRRRAPVVGVRLWVPGDTPIAGEWRLNAEPYFDQGDGRFLGYRGVAVRPRRDQILATDATQNTLRNDSFRQLVHELKTPLNAIIGFSELIEHQLFGPVAPAYRERAKTIRREGERLLGAVEDVDSGARLDTGAQKAEQAAFDLKALVHRVIADLAPLVEERGVRLMVALAEEPMEAIGDSMLAERAISRFLAALVSIAAKDEGLKVVSADVGSMATISIDVPRTLGALSPDSLAAFNFPVEAEWPDAPLLGLEFSLRLVRRMAETMGGALDHDGRRFVLQLPGGGNRSQIVNNSG